MKDNIKFIQGNEACIEGGFMAGYRLYASYPVTPVVQAMEYGSLRLEAVALNVVVVLVRISDGECLGRDSRDRLDHLHVWPLRVHGAG